MHVGRMRWLPTTAAAALATGCLYTADINSPPRAEIDPIQPEVPHKGDMVRLSAFASWDPDDDALHFEWQATVCPDQCNGRVETGTQPTFEYVIESEDPIKVELIVTDPRGARDRTDVMILPVNQAPAVRVDATGTFNRKGHYTVGRAIRLDATASDPDDEPYTLDWSVFAPPGAGPDDFEFTVLTDTTRELVAWFPGRYDVEVTISDGDEHDDDTETVDIDPDLPPCIAATDPVAHPVGRYVVDRADGPRRFGALRVVDELDPFPLTPQAQSDQGVAAFAWSIRTPATGGVFVPIAGHALPEYWLDPAGFAPGDAIDLRVTALDREDRVLDCDVDDARCATEDDSPECWQWLTWGIEVR